MKKVAGILVSMGLILVAALAHAGLYVYEMPDGSRIITDRKLSNPNYRLVRASQSKRGMGQLLARGGRQFARPDPTAYDALIYASARKYGLNRSLVKAVMRTESAFNPYATSRKGAGGLMQLMPMTARQYGVRDLYDPNQNIDAGVRHLKYLLRRFGDVRLAIAAYNAGEGTVRRYRGIPPYAETRAYVRKVMTYQRHYQRHEQQARTRLAAL